MDYAVISGNYLHIWNMIDIFADNGSAVWKIVKRQLKVNGYINGVEKGGIIR
jgi:hypothetical protein